MPLVDGYVDAPVQGISQAAPAVRLPTQASQLDDCMVEFQKGYRKRPPYTYIAKIASAIGTSTPDALTKLIVDPETGHNMLLVVRNSGSGATRVHLHDISVDPPVQQTVNVSTAAQTYLNSGNPMPNQDCRALQIEDYTFILNRKVEVVDGSTASATRPYEALFFFKESGYGFNYNLTVTPSGGSPITGNVLTPDGANFTHSQFIGTNMVAYAMLNGTIGPGAPPGDVGLPYDNTNVGGLAHATAIGAALIAAGFTVALANSVIYISHPTIDFDVSSDDYQGGTILGAIKGVTQTFSNLPDTCPTDGFLVKIQPQNSAGNNAYFVEYNANNGPNGTWDECLGPGVNEGIDPATLPVALTWVSTGVWSVDTAGWTGRTTGDESLVPSPGFVDSYLTDVIYYSGRIGLVYGEGVLFSGAANPFQLYPSTIVTDIDSDPFEVEAPATARSFFQWGVHMYNGIVLVGLRAQAFFQNLNPGDFTASSSQIRELAAYQTDVASIVPPVSSNNRVYLMTPRSGDWDALFEFAADRLSGQILPDDVSAHVPTLLPISIDRAIACDPNFAILYGTTGGTDMYLGIFRYANYQRVQTAWFHWTIPTGFVLAGFVAYGTTFFLVLLDTAQNLHLVRADLNPDELDPDGGTVLTNLDMRCTEAQCSVVSYNATTGNTTITPPIPVNVNTRVSARTPGGSFPEGYLAAIVSYTSTTITVVGDWSAQDFWVGYAYDGIWVPTTIYKRSPGDNRPVQKARLQLTELFLDLVDSLNVSCSVQVKGRGAHAYKQGVTNFGAAPTPFTGPWRVPVNGRNIDTTITINNRSHLGGKVSGFNWFGKFDPFSQRQT